MPVSANFAFCDLFVCVSWVVQSQWAVRRGEIKIPNRHRDLKTARKQPLSLIKFDDVSVALQPRFAFKNGTTCSGLKLSSVRLDTSGLPEAVLDCKYGKSNVVIGIASS